jgi:hypothetical protein
MGIKSAILAFSAIAHAYGIVLSSKYDGNIVIKNEKNVILFLENIIKNYSNYSMKAFDRKAISYRVRKTPVTTHSFYLICSADGIYHTLNFSATGIWAISKGAWAIDTNSDISSYIDYLNGENRWEVKEIMTNNGINTLLTIRNVLSKARSDLKYHFLSKTDKNDNYDNCNTALMETLVENEFKVVKFKLDQTSHSRILRECCPEYN